MPFLNYVKIFFVSLSVFLLLDGVWLGLIAKNFYQKYLGYLLGSVNWLPVVIFYLIYVVGIVVLVIVPALSSNSFLKALFLGALFGLCAYAAYDLTNQSTIKDWPVIVAVVDLLWGTFVSATVSSITYLIASKFL